MFQHAKPFSGFSVDDLETARKFYKETLELDVADAPMDQLELRLDDDTRVFVYEKANHEPATFTILNFPVRDVEKAVDELTAASVASSTTSCRMASRTQRASSDPGGRRRLSRCESAWLG